MDRRPVVIALLVMLAVACIPRGPQTSYRVTDAYEFQPPDSYLVLWTEARRCASPEIDADLQFADVHWFAVATLTDLGSGRPLGGLTVYENDGSDMRIYLPVSHTNHWGTIVHESLHALMWETQRGMDGRESHTQPTFARCDPAEMWKVFTPTAPWL